MVISQGEIWWADLPSPTGSGPGFRRPVIVVQGDALNGSRISTTVCVPLTSNLKWGLGSRKSSINGPPHRFTEGFRGQRLSDCYSGQGSSDRPSRQAPTP